MRLTTINELARRRGTCRKVIENRLRSLRLSHDAELIMGRRNPSPLFDLERPEIARLLTEPQVIL